MSAAPHRLTETEGIDASAYLDLLKRHLLGLHTDVYVRVERPRRVLRLLKQAVSTAPGRREIEVVKRADPAAVAEGRFWPFVGETMIGLKRLDNLQRCMEDVLDTGVPGDFIETGVWRGGSAIFMRAVLKAHGVTDRRVWAADSFEGLPPPNPESYPVDAGDEHHTIDALAVSLERVRSNFASYGLLDDQVRFLKGWFRDTLPTTSNERWAVVRLDGDLYESTMQGLEHLYPRLSVGGYLIVDDYGDLLSCRRAVDDYRAAHGVNEPIQEIDHTGIFWRRES